MKLADYKRVISESLAEEAMRALRDPKTADPSKEWEITEERAARWYGISLRAGVLRCICGHAFAEPSLGIVRVHVSACIGVAKPARNFFKPSDAN